MPRNSLCANALRLWLRVGEALNSNQAEAALKPHLAAAHRTSDCSEDPQDHTDKHENAAERFQNINAGDITDYGENDAEDNHVLPPSIGIPLN